MYECCYNSILYVFDDQIGFWSNTEESYYAVIRRNTDKLFLVKPDKMENLFESYYLN